MTPSPFAAPVTTAMTVDVRHVVISTPIDAVIALLQDLRISALPVLDSAGSIVGVISRTDLIRAGRLGTGGRPAATLTVPAVRAGDLMTQGPLIVTPATSLADAARLLLEHRVHRVFVVGAEGSLVGVLAAVDLARTVAAARVMLPVAEFMTQPIETIDVAASLAEGIARLDALHVLALIVTEDGWPIGTFSQAEALAARDLAPTTPIDAISNPALICLPPSTRAHRAAAHVAQLDVRRVVVAHDQEAVGIVTALDFARIVAGDVRRP